MLEQQSLLLRGWAARTRGTPPRRLIVEPASGELLGFACWQRLVPGSWWRGLLAPVLEVHEAEDEPLLCTVHRYWSLGTVWAVRDADGRAVASVRRGLIEDPVGRCLAVPEPAASAILFHDLERQELATLSRQADGLRLSFTEGVRGEPFAKMALLAAALTLG
jgi:hypothetical protein